VGRLRTEADGSSERNGVFLRSEVEETKTKCKMFVDNKQPKRFGNVKIDNCRSQAVLPLVDIISNSCCSKTF